MSAGNWVGKAWTEVGSNRDMVVRSFKKCGISLSLDGSENGEVHIESIKEYELPTANEITEFELDSESEIEDDEDNFEVTDSCSSSKNESYISNRDDRYLLTLLFSDAESPSVIAPPPPPPTWL